MTPAPAPAAAPAATPAGRTRTFVQALNEALDLLLADVCPRGEDKIVTLGDYIDRGPDSKGVLDRLLDLHRAGRLIALRGNHEMMLLGARRSPSDERYWRTFGGGMRTNRPMRSWWPWSRWCRSWSGPGTACTGLGRTS